MSTETQDLLDRVRTGDRVAGDALVRRFESPLRAYLARRAPPGTADDLFQAVQLEALRSLPSFRYRAEGAYRAWLYGIARNVIASAWRKDSREPLALRFDGGERTGDLVEALVSSWTGPLQRAERMQRFDRVVQALAELPERQREALVLAYMEGLKGPEAAEVLGIAPGAFRALLLRARRGLVAVLDRAVD